MNRRDFFASLGAITVAAALPIPMVTEVVPFDDYSSSLYAKHLARSMLQTKETLTANILNNAFKYTATERYAVDWKDWRGIYGSSGA